LRGEKGFRILWAEVPCRACSFRGIHEGFEISTLPGRRQLARFPAENAVFALEC
jgi:hypothetical protein